MLPKFAWGCNKNKTKVVLSCFALALTVLSGCANIRIQPKDPELIALGNFADQVTLHLFEMNPSTYEQYQGMLDKDLDPALLTQLRSKGSCAKSKEQVKQAVQTMTKTNSRALIHIESTTFPSTATPQGLVPIEVQGTSVKTEKDISRASKFDVIYMIGTNVKTKQPLVASFEIKKFD